MEVLASVGSVTVWEHDVSPDTTQMREYFEWMELAAAVSV